MPHQTSNNQDPNRAKMQLQLTVLASSKISLLLVNVYTSLETVDLRALEALPEVEGAKAAVPVMARRAVAMESFMLKGFCENEEVKG